MNEYVLECAIVRGGTTKGIFLDARQLPSDANLRDQILLKLFGSPDKRQVNGLGGGDPLTSKVALIAPSEDDRADIDYLSGEVGIDEAIINYSTMCGNLASGAALFAVSSGMISSSGNECTVRIRNLNTGKFLSASFQLEAGRPRLTECSEIDWVKGLGTEIALRFHEPDGPISGRLLPGSAAAETIQVRGQTFTISIVDSGTLYAFVEAKALGFTGNESAEQIDRADDTRDLIEEIREEVARIISETMSMVFSSRQIKIALISEVQSDEREKADIQARVVNRYKTHKAYPVTGAICISAAVMIPGTIVHQYVSPTYTMNKVRISHPRGVIETSSQIEAEPNVKIMSTTVKRSARILMSGSAVVSLES